MTIRAIPDFWWLSESQAKQGWLVGVGHHAPLTDDDEPSLTRPNQQAPAISGWFHSLDDVGKLSHDFKRHSPNVLAEWRSVCGNTNVYRTLILWPEQSQVEPLQGPFLVDIDSQDWTNGYSENLEDARRVAVLAVELLTSRWPLAEGRDFRVFFSGRKGFNIEVRPDLLGIGGSLDQQIRASADRLEVLGELATRNSASTVIDRIYGNRFEYGLKHPYIRLYNSWNKWSSDCQAKKRLRLQLSAADLKAQPIESLCSRAENGEV